jgi:hypothetical protein
MSDSFLRFLAAWALLHETADEGWKAAVARGASAEPDSIAGGPDAFVNSLSALVAEEKERLKFELVGGSGEKTKATEEKEREEALAELRFELAEIRGRLESIEVALDTLLKRSSAP